MSDLLNHSLNQFFQQLWFIQEQNTSTLCCLELRTGWFWFGLVCTEISFLSLFPVNCAYALTHPSIQRHLPRWSTVRLLYHLHLQSNKRHCWNILESVASQWPWRTGPGGPSFSGRHQNPGLLLHQPTRHTDAVDLPEGGETLWRRVAQAGTECERRAGEASGGLWGGKRGASGRAAAGDPARLYLHRQEGCRWPLGLGEYQGQTPV